MLPVRPPLLVAALALAALVLGGAAGCVRVKPYQREALAVRAMSPETEAPESRFRQHWQDSREGSIGGFAAAGGGCGCN